MKARIKAVIFDKDGTLFDFGGTWNGWAAEVIDNLAEGDAALRKALAASIRFDPENSTFLPDSPAIAGTSREVAECLARVLPGRAVSEIEPLLLTSAVDAPLQEAVPLASYLAALRDRGLRLGVVTNDSEAAALAHLAAVRITGHFDFVAGFDSGHGMKPAPEPLLAFADAVACDPACCVMIGDSTHDLVAGRRAGMACVGVLTGLAGRADLAPFADAVLPDIGHLGDWLDAS